MSVATAIGVKEAAKRASNRKGGFGVSVRYIRQEIERYEETKGEKGLKAKLYPAPIGKPYYVIQESDFLEWEEKRGRPPGE